MAKRRESTMTMARWCKRAKSAVLREKIRGDTAQQDFQTIVRVTSRRETLDWDEAVALLHMVYGWMPTMLRPVQAHTPEQKERLITHLKKVRDGGLLTVAELADVQRFANCSIVGASKLLHVINPEKYVIWDSRVAAAFLWESVSPATYSTPTRYEEYMNAVRQWAEDETVKQECAALRELNTELVDASDLRLIELVLYQDLRTDRR